MVVGPAGRRQLRHAKGPSRKRGPAPEGERRDGAPKGAACRERHAHFKEGCA